MIVRVGLTLILALSMRATSTLAASPNCANCQAQTKQLFNQQTAQKTHADLLRKNQEYLATLGKGDASKSIKVKSNILVLIVKLETLKNNIESLQEGLTAEHCSGCKGGVK